MTSIHHPTAETIAVAAKILGFHVMEILVEREGRLWSVFLHSDLAILSQYPDMVTGYNHNSSGCSESAEFVSLYAISLRLFSTV